LGFASFREAFFVWRSAKVPKVKNKEATPKSCEHCKHWQEVTKKLRISEVLRTVVTKMEDALTNSEFKASLTDYLKLLQMEKELGTEAPQEIKVTWVEPERRSDET
jgi:lipoate-protein ligase A